jgi:hypothetical protein
VGRRGVAGVVGSGECFSEAYLGCQHGGTRDGKLGVRKCEIAVREWCVRAGRVERA